MLLQSEITGKEYEVKTYTMEDGSRGICHESLQYILENLLGPEVSYNVEALSATSTYCAAKCTITDESGRKIQTFNDVNTRLLEGREPSQEKFAKAHPLLAAVQSAVDAAVRSYLGWPRSFPAEHNEELKIEQEENDFSGMNLPEENQREDYEEAQEEPMDIETINMRLEELGKKNPPSNSKYGKLTYDEVWVQNKSWFNYVQKSNRQNVYADAREYAKLRKLKEELEKDKTEEQQ